MFTPIFFLILYVHTFLIRVTNKYFTHKQTQSIKYNHFLHTDKLRNTQKWRKTLIFMHQIKHAHIHDNKHIYTPTHSHTFIHTQPQWNRHKNKHTQTNTLTQKANTHTHTTKYTKKQIKRKLIHTNKKTITQPQPHKQTIKHTY